MRLSRSRTHAGGSPVGKGTRGRLPRMAKTRFRITFTNGDTKEYEDPMTFDLPGSALKVFNGRERTGVGAIYYSAAAWQSVELIR